MSALSSTNVTTISIKANQKTTRHYRTEQSIHSCSPKNERRKTLAIIAEWRVPGLYGKTDAQKVCNELLEIGDELDEIMPEDIVEAARDENKELHKCFEWRDDVAAEKYRLHQAKQLTSYIVFKREVKEDGSKALPVRIFNKTSFNGGYKIPERTFKVQSEYEALLQRALAELHAFKVKYAALKELDYILELID